MPATAEQLIEREEAEHVKLDMFAEDLAQYNRERIDQLLNEEDERIPEIFELLGADPGVTFSDYADVDVEFRDANWIAGLSALVVASTVQAIAEKREDLLTLLENRNDVLYAERMDKAELEKAAKLGISAKRVKAAKKSLRDAGQLSQGVN